MNAEQMKIKLMCHLRIDRKYTHLATECGYYHSDVLAVGYRDVLEIETKISISDFRADMKKAKHERYLWEAKELQSAMQSEKEAFPRTGRLSLCNKFYYIPDKFYFAVPPELETKALAEIENYNPKYGLIVVKSGTNGMDWNSYSRCVRVVKPAKKLPHFSKIKGDESDEVREERIKIVRNAIESRMSNEMINALRNYYYLKYSKEE
jgi:hypothetical protein